MSLIEAFAILRSSRIVGKVMKSLNGNQGKIVRNVFCSLTRFWVVTAMALTGLSTLAQAQIFYVSQGLSGQVGKVTSAGVPSTFATYAGGDTQGITNDALGNVFVASGTSIRKITPGGASSLYANYANPILGLTMSSGGTLYGVKDVVGGNGNQVGTYSAGGTFTPLTLTNPYIYTFYETHGLKFDGAGNLFAANTGSGGTYANSVVKLTPSGSDWTASSFMPATAGFTPYDIAFDLSGNVYVSSITATSTIAKFNSAGALDTNFAISGINSDLMMAGLTFANSKLYAVAYGSYKVFEIDPTTGAATDFLQPFTNLPDYRSTFLTYTAVPEPSVMALVALGSLALLRRRVSRKTSLGFC